MRFFSSSALAKAPKLRLAASCSAAETISRSEPPLGQDCPSAFAEQVETVAARHKAGHDGRQAACSLVSALGARISTEPPAFSTAATADLEAPNTESVTLALISPSPSSRTPSLARRRRPALTS